MQSFISNGDSFRLFADDRAVPIPLACFYSEFLSKTYQHYARKRSHKIELEDIAENTFKAYLYKLGHFLHWVEIYSKDFKYLSLANHHNIPNELIQYYLNDYLIVDKGLGEHSVRQHKDALTSYFAYLEFYGFSKAIKLYIKPKFKDVARKNTKSRSVIKYLTPDLRHHFVRFANSKRDALLIRMGFECGLRSKENQGLLLKDFNVGSKTYKGMLSLFKDMESNEGKLEFSFRLQGLYSKGSRGKGGKSRDIFLHRSLLQALRDYWVDERPISESNHLFLNKQRGDAHSEVISHDRASVVFANIRCLILYEQSLGKLNPNWQELEKEHTYHVLRHSYGTDKFYELSEESGLLVDNVSSTSQVYLSVAALLGHTVTGKNAASTTKTYIRSCNIKKYLERL
jgi:integrase